MKKSLTFVLSLMLAITMVACKKDPSTNGPNADKPTVTDPDGGDDNNEGTGGGDSESGENEGRPRDFFEAIAALPDGAALDEVWSRLCGYWTAADNRFFAFEELDGSKYVVYGLFESDGVGSAELIEANATGYATMSLRVLFPAMPATETSPARGELYVTVIVDAGRLLEDGTLQIEIIGSGDGQLQYSYSGPISYANAL